MDQSRCWLRTFLVDESGTSTTEYAILVLLIILIAVSAIALLGQQVTGGFNTLVE